MRLDIGQVYRGTYRPLRLLGEGVLGTIYEAEHVGTRSRVALRVLHPELAGRRESAQRFEQEAQAAARLGSKHVVDVLEVATFADGTRFLALELLDGMTLAERIQLRSQLTPEQVAPIIVQLLSGLSAAHKGGIVHKDLKPENVFLLKDKAGLPDFVKILDFGVAHFNVLSAENGMSFARTGAVLGTPFYFSPEQARGARQIDARSDVYAVGAILYECVTGQVPFRAETFNELLFKIVLEAPTPLETLAPQLDPAFASIVHKAMSREPEGRFQSALEFQRALAGYLMRGTGVPRSEPSRTGRTLPPPLFRTSGPPPLPSSPPADHAPNTIRMPHTSGPTTLRMPFPMPAPSRGSAVPPPPPSTRGAIPAPSVSTNGTGGAAEVSLFEEFEEPTIALPRRPTEPPPLSRPRPSAPAPSASSPNATMPLLPPLPGGAVALARPAAGAPAPPLSPPPQYTPPQHTPPPISTLGPTTVPIPAFPPVPAQPTPPPMAQPYYAGAAPAFELGEPPVPKRANRAAAVAAVSIGVIGITAVVLWFSGAFRPAAAGAESSTSPAPTSSPVPSAVESASSTAEQPPPPPVATEAPTAAPAEPTPPPTPVPARVAAQEPDVDDLPKARARPRPPPPPRTAAPPPEATAPAPTSPPVPPPVPTGRTITPDL